MGWDRYSGRRRRRHLILRRLSGSRVSIFDGQYNVVHFDNAPNITVGKVKLGERIPRLTGIVEIKGGRPCRDGSLVRWVKVSANPVQAIDAKRSADGEVVEHRG